MPGLAWPQLTEVSVDSVLQFSKDRHIMDRTPERLKKELEEELLLSSEDLRSHAWYHGRIPRQVPCSLPFQGAPAVFRADRMMVLPEVHVGGKPLSSLK